MILERCDLMEIIKFTKLKDNTYSVSFDDGRAIKLYDDVIVHFNLLVNKKFNIEKLEEIIKYNAELESYYKAIKYINRKLRSKLEIRKYLEKDYDLKTINKTIERLEKDGYLNDLLFTSAYVNSELNLTLNGPYKIEKELNKLGVDDKYIKDELEKIEESIWQERIDKIINKKIKANHNNSLKKLQDKIIYDLGNMGYKDDLIKEIIDNKEIKVDESIINKEGNKIYNKICKKYSGNELKYQLKNKLYLKGFSSEEINNYICHINF